MFENPTPSRIQIFIAKFNQILIVERGFDVSPSIHTAAGGRSREVLESQQGEEEGTFCRISLSHTDFFHFTCARAHTLSGACEKSDWLIKRLVLSEFARPHMRVKAHLHIRKTYRRKYTQARAERVRESAAGIYINTSAPLPSPRVCENYRWILIGAALSHSLAVFATGVARPKVWERGCVPCCGLRVSGEAAARKIRQRPFCYKNIQAEFLMAHGVCCTRLFFAVTELCCTTLLLIL